MSTSALLDNPVLENDQQSVPPPPTRHCRDDLSRAFGVAAYEWSESDQDAIDRRTTNAFLQNNRLNVPQMNPLEAIPSPDFSTPYRSTPPLLENPHAHDFDDLFVPPVYIPLYPPEPILSPFTSSEEREQQNTRGATMDQMTNDDSQGRAENGSRDPFSNEESMQRDNNSEISEQLLSQSLNQTQSMDYQRTVNPETDRELLSSARLSDSPSLSGIRTTSSPPESAGESSSSAHPLSSTSANNTSPRVRFRSRVRIGTGIRHSGSSKAGTSRLALADEDAEASSSASSTISAPLRTFADDSDGRTYAHTIGGRLPGRAYRDRSASEENNEVDLPFSQLLSSDAADGWLRRNHGGRRNAGRRINGRLSGLKKSPGPAATPGDNDAPNERTPLKSVARRRASYDERENDEVDRSVMDNEEDLMFGPWPERLLNRYWWWWKIEGLVCFCCTDSESESESDD